MKSARRWLVVAILGFGLLIGRGSFAGVTSGFRETPRPWGNQTHASNQVDRLRQVMLPLLRATDHPQPLNQVRIRVVQDDRINAATAGGGEFYVTTGLLNKATDNQLRGVLAHEIAHNDLGHPARAQTLSNGLNVGATLMERFFPGSGAIAPFAGMLIASKYSQPQEYEADRHAVRILRRAGYPKEVMIDALAWVMRVAGNSGGGFLSSHPATKDRIRALRQSV